MNGLFARAVTSPGSEPCPAWIQEIVGPFRAGVVLPQPAAASVKRTVHSLLLGMGMRWTAVRCDSLQKIADVVQRGRRNYGSFAFSCQRDAGDCIQGAFGNVLAPPDWARHAAWAFAWARWATAGWHADLVSRFGKLGELITDNLAACLKYELLFARLGDADNAARVRGWSELFLRGNYPGGIFKRGVFVIFVA